VLTNINSASNWGSFRSRFRWLWGNSCGDQQKGQGAASQLQTP
jgi:hypothetical protein